MVCTSVYKWKQHKTLTKHKAFELIDPRELSEGGAPPLTDTASPDLENMPSELGVVLDYDPLIEPDSADEAEIVGATPL